MIQVGGNLPPELPLYDQDVQVIDVFGDVRSDYLLKMTQKMAEMNTRK